jgi:hypothetical protein
VNLGSHIGATFGSDAPTYNKITRYYYSRVFFSPKFVGVHLPPSVGNEIVTVKILVKDKLQL